MKAFDAGIWGTWFGGSFFFGAVLSPRLGTGFFYGPMETTAVTGLGFQSLMAFFTFSLAMALIASASLIASWVLSLAPLSRSRLLLSGLLALISGGIALTVLGVLQSAGLALVDATPGSSDWIENKSVFDTYGFLMHTGRLLLTLGTAFGFYSSLRITTKSII